MENRTKFLLFACLGGLLMVAIYVVPLAVAGYNTTYNSSEITVTGKYVEKSPSLTTYNIYLSNSARVVTDKYTDAQVQKGDTCNLTMRKGEFTEWRVYTLVCNGTELKNIRYIEGEGK